VFYRDPTDSRGLWLRLSELAPVFLENQSQHVESQQAGEPSAWGLRGSTLFLEYPSDGTYPLRITYSWAPTRASHPESFAFPNEAETAFIAYARSILLQDLDPRAAAASASQFRAELCDLRGMGESGESGVRSIYDFLPSEG
jgi:hypothetical protein